MPNGTANMRRSLYRRGLRQRELWRMRVGVRGE
jgi:hypothetical protein